jgi:hypothetical protein
MHILDDVTDKLTAEETSAEYAESVKKLSQN